MQSHHVFSCDQQLVSHIAHFLKSFQASPYIFLWPTESESHCTLWKAVLVKSFLMTNSLWVTSDILWKAVSSHLFLWPTASESHCTCCERYFFPWSILGSEPHCMFCASEKQSHITNREWVTLCILSKAASSIFSYWPTASEWQYMFCDRLQSHHIFTCNKQYVSGIPYFMHHHVINFFLWSTVCEGHSAAKGNLMTWFPMINSQCVTLHILFITWFTSVPVNNRKWVMVIFWMVLSSNLFLWSTVCEWHCTIYAWLCHNIILYGQQYVSYIAHFMKDSVITFFAVTNSLWVTLHILWEAVSSHFSLPPIVCEWYCIFWDWWSYHIFSHEQQQVSDIAHFMKLERQSYHIFSYHQQSVSDINTLWKQVSHLFLWPTASEKCCTFCERQSHHIFSYHQQFVSDIAHFVKASLMILFKCQTVCQWLCIIHEQQFHHFLSYAQQGVSDIIHHTFCEM